MTILRARILFVYLMLFAVVEALPLEVFAIDKKNPRVDRNGDLLPDGAVSRLGTIRFRHASQVIAVVFSPNGKLMATTGYDEEVRLCEATSGKELFRFQLEGKRSNYNGPRIAFSPDGKMLAMANGSGNGALRVVDVSAGKERFKRDLPNQDATTAIAFVAGGKTLGLLSQTSKFDPRTGKRWLEQKVRCWTVETGAEVNSFKSPEVDSWTNGFSPDGKTVAVGDDGLFLCDFETGKTVQQFASKKARINVVAFSMEGTLATTGEDANTIQLWDTATGKPKRLLRGHDAPSLNLALSADGKRLISSRQKNFTVWDAVSGEILMTQSAPVEFGVGCVALSPDGKIALQGSINSMFALIRWDVATGKEVPGPSGHIGPLALVRFLADGKVITGGDGSIRTWDAADGKEFLAERSPFGTLSSDSKTIAIVQQDKTISLRDFATRKDKLVLDAQPGYVGRIAFAPDGKNIAVGYGNATKKGTVWSVILWDTGTGKKRVQIPVPGFSVDNIAFSPDGKTLAIDGSHGFFMWDSATGNELGQVQAKDAGPSGSQVIRFSPDGVLMAAPSYPKGFGVWKTATRERVGRFDGDGVTVRSVAFSTDNRLLACGKEDGAVELWDVKAWKVVGKGQGPRGRVYVLAFSQDDSMLVSGHEDTTALVWNVRKLLAAAKEK